MLLLVTVVVANVAAGVVACLPLLATNTYASALSLSLSSAICSHLPSAAP